MKQNKNTWIYWILALLITLGAAVYQRMTGPTYPKKFSVEIGGQVYQIKLPRSHGGLKDCMVELSVADEQISGSIHYRRFPTNDEWTSIPLKREDGLLKAALPNQPPAGKLAYYLILEIGSEAVDVARESPAIIRYKGDVPSFILAPHVLFMFLAMFLSNASGLMALGGISRQVQVGRITLGFLAIGGMILGPVVQLYAFGELWTGIPFGWDLTDNKTLIAFIFWVVAVVANGKKERPWATVVASAVLLLIYSIPHSMFGSELDYESGTVIQGMVKAPQWWLF